MTGPVFVIWLPTAIRSYLRGLSMDRILVFFYFRRSWVLVSKVYLFKHYHAYSSLDFEVLPLLSRCCEHHRRRWSCSIRCLKFPCVVWTCIQSACKSSSVSGDSFNYTPDWHRYEGGSWLSYVGRVAIAFSPPPSPHPS
jgi:hypothetical protein